MTNRNYIVLLLVLGTISSFSQYRFSIPDPTDLDYQNVFNRTAQNLPTLPIFSKLLVPAKFELTASGKNLLTLTSEQNENINIQKYLFEKTTSNNKHKVGEPQKQYAWYVENRLWLENKTESNKSKTGLYANTSNHGPGTLVKMLNSAIQNFNFSIHKVGEHYSIV